MANGSAGGSNTSSTRINRANKYNALGMVQAELSMRMVPNRDAYRRPWQLAFCQSTAGRLAQVHEKVMGCQRHLQKLHCPTQIATTVQQGGKAATSTPGCLQPPQLWLPTWLRSSWRHHPITVIEQGPCQALSQEEAPNSANRRTMWFITSHAALEASRSGDSRSAQPKGQQSKHAHIPDGSLTSKIPLPEYAQT